MKVSFPRNVTNIVLLHTSVNLFFPPFLCGSSSPSFFFFFKEENSRLKHVVMKTQGRTTDFPLLKFNTYMLFTYLLAHRKKKSYGDTSKKCIALLSNEKLVSPKWSTKTKKIVFTDYDDNKSRCFSYFHSKYHQKKYLALHVPSSWPNIENHPRQRMSKQCLNIIKGKNFFF